MDKYRRQSEKTNQWARRRNTTAGLQLEGQLRYLERGCSQRIKQHFREKFRLQDELRGLTEASGDCEVTTHPVLKISPVGSTTHASQVGGRRRGKLSVNSSPSTKKDCGNTSPFRSVLPHSITPLSVPLNSECGSTCETLYRSLSEATFQHHDGQSYCTEDEESNNGEFSMGVSQNISNQRSEDICERSVQSCRPRLNTTQSVHSLREHDLDRVLQKTRRENSGCRYARDALSKSHLICGHFPCKVPATYHSIGFRRDDIRTWSMQNHKLGLQTFDLDRYDENEECETKYDNCPSTSLFDKQNETKSVMTINSSSNSIRKGENSSDEEPNTPCELLSWCNKEPPKREIKFRPASGPSFVPKPSDPLLEKVRQGTSRPVKPARQSSRATVEGRLRGLQALVVEMRARHERAKPVDWAVNYGKRLPMRILLNPVVPVSL